jgi:predicted outer membrane repeat protein
MNLEYFNNLTINNTNFVKNKASLSGGGIYISQ